MSDEDANILKNLLATPHDRERFDSFYQLCYREVCKSLRYLTARGYRLPLDQTDPKHSLGNLTIDILGNFLRSESNRPFCVIFDFFASRGITDFADVGAEILYDLFLGLLRSYVKQELHRLRKQEDPQVAKLKRRFNEILRDGPYQVGELVTPKRVAVTEPADYEELLAVAEQAFSNSRDTTQWCARIFSLWQEQDNQPLCVRKSDLLRAAISIYFKYVELDGFRPVSLAGPREEAVRTELERARHKTLQSAEDGLLKKFQQQKRLRGDEASVLLGATEKYLIDFFDGTGADAIPVYFREALPQVDPREYPRRYKYVFETLINGAVEEMRRRLQESPTIRSLRHY